jgi:general secretion pathway protein L
MLRRLAAWWWRQIAGLTPRRAAPDAVIVALDALAPARGAILVRRGGAEQRLGAIDLDRPSAPPRVPRLPCLLRLPAGAVLSRSLRLPAAAAGDFASAAAFELDRATPFEGGDMFFSLGPPRRDPGGRTLSATLTFTLRAPVAPVLAALARLRLAPAAIESPAGPIPLATPGRRRYALVLAALLALLALALPVIRQQQALDDARARIAALTPAAAQAAALRQRLVAAAGFSAVLTGAADAGPLRTLARLTAALPDDTYLADLTLKSGVLTFDGQSADAARLIALLAATPGLRNPSFAAPVTRTISGTADVFSIRAVAAP